MPAHGSAISKKTCSKCDKTAGSFSCDGCQQSFCLKHVAEHRQELVSEIDIVEQNHDIFYQDLQNQAQKHDEHIIFNQIYQWEKESILTIEQTATRARAELHKILDSIVDHGTDSLNKISSELRRARESDDFFETDLAQWNEKLKLLRTEIESMSNNIYVINENSISCIKFIEVTRKQAIKSPDAKESSRFSWLLDVKALFDEFSEKSSSRVKSDKKNSAQATSKRGCIKIIDVNNTDHYIDIEHDGSTKKDQNMTGWKIARDVNKESEFIYTFPDHFILKCRSNVRISSSSNTNETMKEKDKNLLIYEDTKFWNIGACAVTHLIDNNDEEKDSTTQTIPSSSSS
ncbi:unnamed protein product [Rotaria magnacalcarata]|uniref:LTD domain-containing protein n=1 Tax=Rotaria magnacalcarata TaxID=392030 RepID=A0A816PDQ2_9BILA|nr:unnamed protein product [Rotaria magnacalcarata]CAF3839691.1 unnamed protein product [Rotaria magnacalcarata]